MLDVRCLPGVVRRLTGGTRGAILIMAHLGLLLVSLLSIVAANADPLDYMVVARCFITSIAGTGLGTILTILLILPLLNTRGISCLVRAGFSVVLTSAQWLITLRLADLHIQF